MKILIFFLLNIKNILKSIIDKAALYIRIKRLLLKGYHVDKTAYIGPRCSISGNRIVIGKYVTIVSDAKFMEIFQLEIIVLLLLVARF